ncbi:hypothetical protein C8Q76DRAFT_598847, partial [Earliella scabrosa]
RNVTRRHLDVLFRFSAVNVSSVAHSASGLVALGDMSMRSCSQFEYVFSMLSAPRKDSAPAAPAVSQTAADIAVAGDLTPAAPPEDTPPDHDYLQIADAALRKAIITEWEHSMSKTALQQWVCAACGCCTSTEHILFVKPAKVNFSLLRNDYLPEDVLPVSYNRTAYGGAILHPKGLECREERGNLRLCAACWRDLRKDRMPRFALANFLYYGHDRLPADVKDAFAQSTHVERLLISRARASRISYRFSELPGHELKGTDPRASQSCVKGNVAIHPQDATHLNDVLPPSNDVIRDSVCAIFVGKTQPTKENIENLNPVVVRKSRVHRMINFLIEKNDCYEVAGRFGGFSQANMDALFGPGTEEVDEGVLCAMEVGHVELNDAITAATDSYVPGSDDPSEDKRPTDDDMLIENVGYTDSDDSPINFKQMSMRAVAHCLMGGGFVKSQAGSKFVPDFENPSLLSWLFPHLDPWGIGGFHEPRRLHSLSMDQQLKHLLTVEGSIFRKDPDFAFVYYNIRQKKAVFDSISFRVSASERERVIADLMKINVDVLDRLIKETTLNPRYKPQDKEEAEIFRLLLRVNTTSHDLPGSNGYKLALRNQIRSLINFEGPPTLFVTLNPSDRDHPLVQLYAGREIDIEDKMRGEELSRWQRSIIAARNPDACAQFFNTMINNFIDIVLRFGRPGKGLFG